MIRLKNKNNNTIDIFNKRNLKKEYVFNLTSFKIALSQAKVNKNYSEIKNLRKQFHQYKDEYHRKLKAFRIQK
jgi:hypothetical protein